VSRYLIPMSGGDPLRTAPIPAGNTPMFGEDETLADRGKIRCRGATRRRLKDAQEHLDSSTPPGTYNGFGFERRCTDHPIPSGNGPLVVQRIPARLCSVRMDC
jgi:hypothetical protein